MYISFNKQKLKRTFLEFMSFEILATLGWSSKLWLMFGQCKLLLLFLATCC